MERVYTLCLHVELEQRGHEVKAEVPLEVVYGGRRLGVGYRIDLLVDECLVVEVKSVEALERVHRAQLLSYLRLAKLKLGLLVNFNEEFVRDGIKRVAN